MRPARRHIPPEFIRTFFRVDESSGVVFWKHHHRRTELVGSPAGTIGSKGYYITTLSYQGKPYKILNHRIVWVLVYGAWPIYTIDHINRVRTDNRPSNLRDVTIQVNISNRPRCGDTDRILPAGVGQMKNGKFKAWMYVRSKQVHLGVFPTSDLAAAAYQRATSTYQTKELV